MGRHRTEQEKVELGARARQLREQGWSRERIEAELQVGDTLLGELLAGTRVPTVLRRPRARDDARDLARQLRRAGWTYDQIARELGVAKSSCSLWLRDLPRPEPVGDLALPDGPAPARDQVLDLRLEARRLRREGALLGEVAEVLQVSLTAVSRWCAGLPVPPRARHGRHPDEVRAMGRARWDRLLAGRQVERDQNTSSAAAQVGALTGRELELLALAVYWAEGAKSKPYARREQVTFINSDEGMVLLWLAYLDHVGFPAEHRRYQLSIHETADLDAAHRAWSAVIGVPPDRFQPPSLKRHRPTTNRKNVNEHYKGCLVVRLVQCRTRYQRIEGGWQGIMAATAPRAV
ncbi:MAG: hypothetical protein JWO60_1892 [Frankiales bacterium]|nr:hypothetical protein [Frankiales bacterium]